ncbi:MAG TPA: hypothetical protein VMD77_00060, partial [Candidatus Baltobacteraceae bacterium]|nr:hypothetical protein [Candidatus Baltobacteraceae bacterium]
MTQASDRAVTSTSTDEIREDSAPSRNSGVLAQSARFIGEYWRRMLGISALILAPCFWHRRIEACDLGSHVYNAWLAQLIRRGEAPGLWIAHQWTNVLFDLLLSFFGSIFGLGTRFHATEKIAVSLCVLIFFWGAFALAAAATRRPPWMLTP